MSAVLPIRLVERPWGREALPAPFAAPSGQRIGEIWFEPPPALDQLLVKYIFTSEALSVQVHPSNAEAQAAGKGSRGKEECWYVLDAEPGAVLGIGFERPVGAEEMRAAALDRSIEGLLAWHPVKAGDFVYIPAGTVHAIGAGIALVEVQQNSDITYRLYDYGRGRELHLDAGIAVARGEVLDSNLFRHVAARGDVMLVDGPLFRLARCQGAPSPELAAQFYGSLLAIPLSGELELGCELIRAGECALAGCLADVGFGSGLTLLAQACQA